MVAGWVVEYFAVAYPVKIFGSNFWVSCVYFLKKLGCIDPNFN